MAREFFRLVPEKPASRVKTARNATSIGDEDFLRKLNPTHGKRQELLASGAWAMARARRRGRKRGDRRGWSCRRFAPSEQDGPDGAREFGAREFRVE